MPVRLSENMSRYRFHKIKPIKVDIEAESSDLTLWMYGNLTEINHQIYIWCLFKDEQGVFSESLLPFETIYSLRLGAQFKNQCLHLNPTHSAYLNTGVISQNSPFQKLPTCFQLPLMHGEYLHQIWVRVNDVFLQWTDILLRVLCSTPELARIAVSQLSQPFVFQYLRIENNHVHIKLDRLYSFKLNPPIAKQLTLIACSPEYRAWLRAIATYSGEMLSTDDGAPWLAPVPPFDLNLYYAKKDSIGQFSRGNVLSVKPKLALAINKASFYRKNHVQTFNI